MIHQYTHPFNGPFSGTTQASRYQKGKTIWIFLKQKTVSGSGISWAICKSARRSRQTTTPVPLHLAAWYINTSIWMPYINTHTHTRLTALFPGLPRWAGTRKVKPIWILLKQETVRGRGISWAICKSVACSRQITTPASQCSVFYRPGALPAAQPTTSKHWRQNAIHQRIVKITLTCPPEIVVFSYHWCNR